MFFKINDEKNQTVHVDARDGWSWTPLHLALEHQNAKGIELLLIRGANPTLVEEDGSTPLHSICMQKDGDYLLQTLFKSSSNKNHRVHVDAQDNNGDTPLHMALESERKEVVELLLKNGATPNLANKEGLTPLHVICNRNDDDDDLAKLFFKINNDMQQSVHIDARDKSGRTPLHGYKDKPNVDENGKPLLQRTTALLHSAKLVISNNKELVRCLFKIYDRYDANYTDERGLTHFHIACRHDFDDIVKKFLEHGLDPNIPQTEEVTTPLNLTIDHKRKKCFKLLLRNGANNPNRANDEGMTPLHRLCEKDVNYDWMELFFEINDEIQQTVLVDARANNGDTPMHTALYDEEIEKFKFLLKRRADPNIANEEGLTPLHIICSRKIDDDLAKIFLKLNDGIHQTVQIDVQDKLGSTPLHWALNCGNKKVTEILLKKGADLNLAERDGWTPLHFFCTSSSYNNLMKILFEISDEKHQLVHLDAKNKKGDTPLYLALSSDNKKAVELLLRRGANPNLADADGSTSLHLICKRNNDDDLVDVFSRPST
ncbi:unnamed protein product [Trichogramma brassicae]|uniref:Uncharacterized protein n=1 Tax=Trichogramma brassicae TaxID=86971 RepID=A0A6H5IYJ1_9HYME|nr:unnamed protein product [Trichogramma brassicae]